MRTRSQLAWVPGEPTEVDDDLDARVEQARSLLNGRRVVAVTGGGDVHGVGHP